MVILLVAGVGAGKWAINRAYENHRQTRAQRASDYTERLENLKATYDRQLRQLLDTGRLPDCERVLKTSLQRRVFSYTTHGYYETYRGRPAGLPLNYELTFTDRQLRGFYAWYPLYVDPEPAWWVPAESLRHYGLAVAAMAWLILLIGAIGERSLRRRFGKGALAIAMLCAVLLATEPEPASRVFRIHVPGAPWVGGGLVTVSFALLMIRRRQLSGEPQCPHCGYNLTGNVSGICPECGNTTPEEIRRAHDERTAALAQRLVAVPAVTPAALKESNVEEEGPAVASSTETASAPPPDGRCEM